jgi:hypothetical protein
VREFHSDDPGGVEYANPLEGVTFTLDGMEFKCEGEPDLLDTSELALLASQATDMRTPEAQASIAAFLQMAFGPQVYRQFRMHTKEHKTPPEVILAVIDMINEELEDQVVTQTGRPTGLPSPSSPGGPGKEDRIANLTSLGTGDVTVIRPGKSKGKSKGGGQDAPSRVVKLGSRSKTA